MGEEPPDFVYIDKMVKEYQQFREAAPPTEDCSPDATVEKIMKCFDNGDYPNILYLWDNAVSQKLSTVDPVVVHEAGVAEFYMHVHCATAPFRQSTIARLPNPGAAAKLAARSMTIFKHYVDTKGKPLAATPEFHTYKHLPKIAFPPTHPKYSHLFSHQWITETRESYFKFLIPFLKDTEYPSLCAVVASAAQNIDHSTSDSSHQIQHIKDKERQTAKIAKALFEAASDFLDMIGEDGMSARSSIDELQVKLKELGKALLPNSPSHSPAQSHAHIGDSMVSMDATDIKDVKKKKKVRKKVKPNYDYTLIGSDLSSMIVELITELGKLLHEGIDGNTQSLSVDMDMATQSAFQGCLLIKALRHIICAEEHKLELTSPIAVNDGVPEHSPPADLAQPPSPRSKGGSVDKIIVSMTQGDLLGVTSKALSGSVENDNDTSPPPDSGPPVGEEGDNAVVGSTALPFEELLDAYMRATEYIRGLPVVEEPNEEAVIAREDKMLMDTIVVLRYFIEDYISLVAHVCTSISGVQYLADSNTGSALYAKIIRFLLQLKPVKDDMMVKLHVVCLCTIITIGQKMSHCLETFVQHGGAAWMSATLTGLLSLDEEVAESLPGHENYLDLCMGLLHQVVRESSCRKILFDSASSVSSAIAISFLLVNLIISQTGKLKDGVKLCRASMTPPAEILFYLLENAEIRNSVRDSTELNTLKELVVELDKDESIAIKLVHVKSVLRNVDSTEVNPEEASSSVSDLVYSVGVLNLVSDMLGTLHESEEVLKYREENAAYSTNNHILEKYKQSPNVVVFSPN